MKTLILSCCGVAAFLAFSACESEHHHDHAQSSTTTTEETTSRQPMSATTETQTVRTN